LKHIELDISNSPGLIVGRLVETCFDENGCCIGCVVDVKIEIKHLFGLSCTTETLRDIASIADFFAPNKFSVNEDLGSFAIPRIDFPELDFEFELIVGCKRRKGFRECCS
jgi:hypothetical protein